MVFIIGFTYFLLTLDLYGRCLREIEERTEIGLGTGLATLAGAALCVVQPTLILVWLGVTHARRSPGGAAMLG